MVEASITVEGGGGQLIPADRLGLALVLLGFVGSFAFIRMSTRLMRSPRVPWWPGSVVSGGVHLHHLAFGIVLMMAAGATGFAFAESSPWFEICAGLFGVGVGLTFDEFALWIHLDDVYWSEEGRTSIDATVIAAAMMGFVLLGVRPLDFNGPSLFEASLAALGALVAVIVCFFKQRLVHGAFGFFFFPIALYGAVRLGKPGSPWARRLYGERRPAKQARAEERFRANRRTERFKQRLRDIIGGSTEEVYEAKLAERAAAAAGETATQMRERADDG